MVICFAVGFRLPVIVQPYAYGFPPPKILLQMLVSAFKALAELCDYAATWKIIHSTRQVCTFPQLIHPITEIWI